MGRTLCLLVLCALVLRVQSWPGEEDLGSNSNHGETEWRTETGNTAGGAATSEEGRREKRQERNEGDATSLKHLAIEKALTARRIPPTHKGKIQTSFFMMGCSRPNSCISDKHCIF